jgi:hypothetical protein
VGTTSSKLFGWQDRRCWPTTRRFTRPAASTAAPNKNLESSVAWVGRMGARLRSLLRNMLWLCHISEIDIEYRRVPMRWRRNTRSGASCHTMAHPDYGDAGIYREGHRASSKAKPRRDATFVPRSSERLICRCRGQIGPESDGRLRRAHDRIRQAATLASPGMVPLCLLLRDSPTSISRVRGSNRRPLARQKHLGEPR